MNHFSKWKPCSVICNGLGCGCFLTLPLQPHWLLSVAYFVVGLMLVTVSFLLEQKRTV